MTTKGFFTKVAKIGFFLKVVTRHHRTTGPRTTKSEAVKPMLATKGFFTKDAKKGFLAKVATKAFFTNYTLAKRP